MKKFVFVHSYEMAREHFEAQLKRQPPRKSQLTQEALYPYLVGAIDAIVNTETTPSAKVQSIKNCLKAFDDITQ